MQGESPTKSKINALGIYLLCSLGFVVSALIEFAIIVLLKRKSVTTNNKVGSKILPKRKIDAGAILRQRIRRTKKWKYELEKAQSLNHRNDSSTMSNDDGMSALLIAIDFTSFWTFIFLYILFNCIYWGLVLSR